jgi:NADH dehydrogenase FAD-containing subunit
MSDAPTRVLILGGGFAGLSAARAFERQLRRHRRIAVTLLCRNNYLLFTPMLAEVASGAIESATSRRRIDRFCAVCTPDWARWWPSTSNSNAYSCFPL